MIGATAEGRSRTADNLVKIPRDGFVVGGNRISGDNVA
jgi:hypothetical protein